MEVDNEEKEQVRSGDGHSVEDEFKGFEIPKTMKALVIVEQWKDSTDVFKLQEMPVPLVEKDEILVQVYSSSINPVDWKIAKGALGVFGPGFPHIGGRDFAGKVVLVGSSVKDFKVGDRVWGDTGTRSCSWAEYLAIGESYASIAPFNMPLHVSGSLPLVGLTSIQSLRSVAESDRVLILGGSGGTGSTGIQIAKSMGAYVAATSSTRNLDYIKEVGADEAIDYTLQGSWVEPLKGQDYDLIYDTVGEEDSYDRSYPVLRPGGSFVTITSNLDVNLANAAKLGGKFVVKKFWQVMGYNKFEVVMVVVNKKDLVQLSQLVENKRVTNPVSKEYKFTEEDIREMVLESKGGRVRGKLCLVIKREQEPKPKN